MAARASAVLRSLASAASESFGGFAGLREQLGVFAGGPGAVLDALAEGAQAIDGGGGFGEAVEGEVELVAVGHR